MTFTSFIFKVGTHLSDKPLWHKMSTSLTDNLFHVTKSKNLCPLTEFIPSFI